MLFRVVETVLETVVYEVNADSEAQARGSYLAMGDEVSSDVLSRSVDSATDITDVA